MTKARIMLLHKDNI